MRVDHQTETQANVEVVHQFFDSMWNRGDLAIAEQILGVNHVHHLGQRELNGPEAVKGLVRSLPATFPDLKLAVEDKLVCGDKVVVRYTATGTQRGPLGDIAATDRSARWGDIDIIRIESGRIVELWARPMVWDCEGN